MANTYVSSVAYAAVAQWAASTAYTVGQIIRQLATPAVGSERCFRCTTAGTSGTTEPTWTLTKNSTTTSGTAVFTECSGQEAYQSPGNWAAPFARLFTPMSVSGFFTAGDVIFVASNHTELNSASTNYGTQGSDTTAGGIIPVISVDSSASSHMPPTSADFLVGAAITANSGTLTLQQCHLWGLFITLTGTAGLALSAMYGDNIIANMSGTSGLVNITGRVELFNPSITLASAQILFVSNSLLIRSNGSVAFTGRTTTVIGSSALTNAATVVIEGVDLSAVTGRLTSNASHYFALTLVNCKLAPFTDLSAAVRGSRTDVVNCDSGTKTYRHERYWFEGLHRLSTNVIIPGGASDGTTAISWSVFTSASGNTVHTPFEAMPISIWNTTVGSPVTVNIEGVANSATMPTNMTISMLTSYFANSATTLGGTDNNSAFGTNPLITSGTNWTATTTAWDTGATARANSTGYGQNESISVASAPGQIFFCTSGGTSASSQPAGYASCADGSTVTDGTAVFRAGIRFKMSTTITPQQVGFIRCVMRFVGNSLNYYIDPVIRLT